MDDILLISLVASSSCESAEFVSQSVSHYHTPSRELMDHTHLLFFYFEYGDNLCTSLYFIFFPPFLLSSARARTSG